MHFARRSPPGKTGQWAQSRGPSATLCLLPSEAGFREIAEGRVQGPFGADLSTSW